VVGLLAASSSFFYKFGEQRLGSWLAQGADQNLESCYSAAGGEGLFPGSGSGSAIEQGGWLGLAGAQPFLQWSNLLMIDMLILYYKPFFCVILLSLVDTAKLFALDAETHPSRYFNTSIRYFESLDAEL
jgi:hypothetical protein